jgi:CBS domain-containing protein
MGVERDLEAEQVGHLDLSPGLLVQVGTRVGDVVAQMCQAGRNCALVTGPDGRLAGIFTERDVLHKVATAPETLQMHIEAIMTPEPDIVAPEDCVGAALRFMNQGHYRHVPVVDRNGKVLGYLTDYAIIRFLSDRLQDKIYNRAPDDQVARTPEGA